jgi:hypothetical protein
MDKLPNGPAPAKITLSGANPSFCPNFQPNQLTSFHLLLLLSFAPTFPLGHFQAIGSSLHFFITRPMFPLNLTKSIGQKKLKFLFQQNCQNFKIFPANGTIHLFRFLTHFLHSVDLFQIFLLGFSLFWSFLVC